MIQFKKQLANIPEPLRELVSQHCHAYLRAVSDSDITVPKQEEFLRSAIRVWACSNVAANQCIRHPEVISDLFDSGDMLHAYGDEEYATRLFPLVRKVSDIKSLKTLLRKFRDREMLRLIWRDVMDWSPMMQTTAELSSLADACVNISINRLHEWQCEYYGMPEEFRGLSQNMIAIALGKLGGQELNLSSDIDLVFAYPARGETQGGEKSISHEQFFNRLARDLIQVLNENVLGSFVFRVDVRLRPFGDSGPLVISFSALENYFQEHGREWERYAFVKARIISGNARARAALLPIIRNFVYRHYLDYTALQSLRDMHTLILKDAKKRKLSSNIKVGWGGIREIEFVAQTYQLMHGGEGYRLQGRQLLKILPVLEDSGFLSVNAVKSLVEAYYFFRNVEHRLQAVDDRQTHQIPDGEVERIRLAFSMGFDGWEKLDEQLTKHRSFVKNLFQTLMAKPQVEQITEQVEKEPQEISAIWLGKKADEDTKTSLEKMGFSDSVWVMQLLSRLRESQRFKALGELGEKRLNDLMPIMLVVIAQSENPELALKRFISVLEALMKRTAYMVLLLENPTVLKQLIKLCTVSVWVTDHLSRYPMLLGQLLNTARLYAPLDRETLEITLNDWIAAIPEDEFDEQMEALRRYKLINLFRIAAMDLMGVLPVMRVSDHLTDLACVILRKVQNIAWKHLVATHGYPGGFKGRCDLMIIAYGKLGGLELGYGSDLDLVFVRAEHPEGQTNGREPISNSIFYTRLGRRIVRMLGALKNYGLLYEIDLRLRPSGESGVLVPTIKAFISYQEKQAWVWEHQALVRARAISGPNALIEKFNETRKRVITQTRDPSELCATVREMRDKMRAAAKSPPEGKFDLKQGVGGMADIEFIVQFGVLRWASECPALLEFPDNIRILECLGKEELLSVDDVRLLSNAYRAYRATVHRMDLQKQTHYYLPDDRFLSYREGATKIWRKLLG